MAEIMSKTGYKWLYDATRAKISNKLQKEGADAKQIQKFFNVLDKKSKSKSGKSGKLAQIEFEDHVTEMLDKKDITSIVDVKKHAPKMAKKVKVVVRYKKDTLFLLVDKKVVAKV